MAQRAHTRRAQYKEVFATGRDVVNAKRHTGGAVIIFSKKDEKGMLHPHVDALVASCKSLTS